MNADVIPVMQQVLGEVNTLAAAPLGIALLALAALNIAFGALWAVLHRNSSD